MDVKPFSSVRAQKFSWGFAMALRWAVLEWLLMFMLFIDATISYLVTKFAHYSKLQLPCLLCSRLDHVIGKESVGFYWDLVCENHKSEIHKKLVNVDGTCENGALSFSSINKSNAAKSCILLTSNGDSCMGKNGFDHLSHLEYPSSALSLQAVNPNDNVTVPHEQLITDNLTTEKLKKPDSVCVPTVLEDLNKPISFDEQGVRETSNAPPEEAGEMGKRSVMDIEDISESVHERITTAETHIETIPVTNTAGLQMPSYLDLGDAYKLAVGHNRRQLSGKFAEQRSLKESLSVSEDLKLLSQRSFARGLELPLNDISPRLSGQIDELKTPDDTFSMSVVMQLLQKRVSLERNQSGLSVDGNSISDIEGESAVDRLKRQVEHDRKLMGALYKELEEERNASAIATNQAMAMITRLQEEKAALNMEALQCLRVMEDQADYDVEALEKANGLLAEKEIKIRDIESELELYRKKFGDISILGNATEASCERINSSSFHCNSVSEKDNERCETDGTVTVFSGSEICAAKSTSLLEFEDERLYILQCLKKLENELNLFSNDRLLYTNTDGGDFSGSFEKDDEREEEDNLQKHDDDDDVIIYKEENGIIDLVTVKKELSDLSVRLEALKADQSFINHSINSLRNGSEGGVKFVEEIACHLRELRRIGIRRRRRYHQPSA